MRYSAGVFILGTAEDRAEMVDYEATRLGKKPVDIEDEEVGLETVGNDPGKEGSMEELLGGLSEKLSEKEVDKLMELVRLRSRGGVSE